MVRHGLFLLSFVAPDHRKRSTVHYGTLNSVARTFVAGKRLLFRPLTGTTDAPPSVGIAHATKGDVTPAGEKFCQILRQTSFLSERRRHTKLLAGSTKKRGRIFAFDMSDGLLPSRKRS